MANKLGRGIKLVPPQTAYTPLVLTLILGFGSSLAAAPLPAGDAAAAGFSTEKLAALHRLVESHIDDGRMAGAITLLARHGKIVDARTYGLRDVAQTLPMERDSLMRIFSLTKPVIAVLTLMLWEEGRFELDDPIADFLPAFRDLRVASVDADGGVHFEPARPITIRHLLTHTSGISYDWNANPAVKARYPINEIFNVATMPEFAGRLAQVPLNFQPGDAFLYGANFDVLGCLIEALTRQPLETVLEERIFRPLGMTDTCYTIPVERRDRLAAVHRREATGRLRFDPPDVFTARALGGNVFPNGSGGLISTADDYARFAQMLLNEGELDGHRLLKPSTVALMASDQLKGIKTPTTFMGPDGTYGLGVGVWPAGRDGRSSGRGRFGWTGYATTYCNIDPVEGTVAILFAQHLPYDEFGLFPRFNAAFYQALLTAPGR